MGILVSVLGPRLDLGLGAGEGESTGLEEAQPTCLVWVRVPGTLSQLTSVRSSRMGPFLSVNTSTRVWMKQEPSLSCLYEMYPKEFREEGSGDLQRG